MHALTLYRPWTWAICHPSDKAKRVENRTWSPPLWIRGKDIAIHAGVTYDSDARRLCVKILGETPPIDCPGGVVAVARVAGERNDHGVFWFGPGDDARNTSASVAGTDGVRHDGGEWFCGPVGWLLDNVRVLSRPVPCKGLQGLWRLTPAVERAVQELVPARVQRWSEGEHS